MTRLILGVGVSAVALIAAMAPLGAQQQWVLRDMAMGGGNFYLRGPVFVEASKATFMSDDDRVVGITGEGMAKAYVASALTWHHGVEDQIGRLPVFATW